MAGRALVLGGGGVTGVAWELGVLAGLLEAGVDLTDADVLVGTSAGSVVAAIVGGGESIEQAYQRQLAPPKDELAARVGLGVILRFAGAALVSRDPKQTRARIGRMALRAKPAATEQERRAVIAARLSGADWPTTQQLRITAVAAEDGAFVVFTRDSGVSLVDAVAASCAVPVVWPPTTIAGRKYVDGGMKSPANVDVAADCDRIVVFAPTTASTSRAARLTTQLAALPTGTRSVAFSPDQQARKAIGTNVLDPAARAGAARAGRHQGVDVAAAVRAVWQE